MSDNKTQLINIIKNRVIGYPLEHTQSPLLHNTVYQLLNCNAVMLEQPHKNLLSLMKTIKKSSVGLVAVTMPFKEEILPYLDEMSPEVEYLKAANTVIYRHGKLWGYNTDIDGIHYALRHQILSHKNVLIIGAGGAARAVAYYLQKNQANLWWLNRTYAHAFLMKKLFGGTIINRDSVDSIDRNAIDKLAIDIIINTTPVGMFPDYHQSPLLNYLFQENQIVFDMVYNPENTMLLKKAKSSGAVCISGLDMFIAQGLRQIELWLNKSISISEMIDPIKTILKKSQVIL